MSELHTAPLNMNLRTEASCCRRPNATAGYIGAPPGAQGPPAHHQEETTVRQAVIGAALLVAGAVCVALGLLPLDDLGELAARVLPVLGFVLGLTIVSELAADAGVFDRLA